MTLTKLAKWSSVGLLIGVVLLVGWSYVNAHEQGRLPTHHPWPGLSLVGGAVGAMLIGAGKDSRSVAVAKLGVVTLFAISAVIYLSTLL